MLKRLKKQDAFTVIHKNNQGFTLISILLTITILFTTLPLLGYLIKSATYTSNYDELSIQQFFHYLRDDFLIATDYDVSTNKITLGLENGTQASIESYTNTAKDVLIRRRVDGFGHEVYLMNIEAVTFSPISYGVHVIVTSLQGEQYEKTIIFYD